MPAGGAGGGGVVPELCRVGAEGRRPGTTPADRSLRGPRRPKPDIPQELCTSAQRAHAV